MIGGCCYDLDIKGLNAIAMKYYFNSCIDFFDDLAYVARLDTREVDSNNAPLDNQSWNKELGSTAGFHDHDMAKWGLAYSFDIDIITPMTIFLYTRYAINMMMPENFIHSFLNPRLSLPSDPQA